MLQILRKHPESRLPVRATPGSVGLDLYACLWSEDGRPNRMLIPPQSSRVVPTGLVVKPPEGYTVFVCSRSGMAYENCLFVANSPGIVDPDYRGELGVLLYNGGHESRHVVHGDRVGQMIILPCTPTMFEEVTALDPTERGEAGFGSTGR